jgi:hypothetical protein
MTDLRERYEAYREQRERCAFRFAAGLDGAPDLAVLDDGFGDLTSGDALDALRADRDAATFADARAAADRLLTLVQGVVLAARTRELTSSLQRRARAQRVRAGAHERSAAEWRLALPAATDAAERGAIQGALDRAWAELNPLREELCAERSSVLAGLGHATPRAFAQARRPGVDLDAWNEQAERLLRATQSGFADLVRGACAEAEVEAGGAHRGDWARVAALPRYARFFSADRLGAALDFTTAGLGARFSDVAAIESDSEEREGKQPASLCFAPRVPEEVLVSVWPRAGVASCEGLLRAAGCALQLAFTSPALPVERRCADDLALQRSWGLLLARRIGDREWIESAPVAAKADSFRDAIRFRRLLQMRSTAARARFELALASLPPGTDPRSLDASFAEVMSEASGATFGPEGYLVDTSLDLLALDELRALCLEAQLAEHLRERFGHRFFEQRAAGDLLKELWNTGTTLSAEELAAELSLGPLGSDALIESCLRTS